MNFTTEAGISYSDTKIHLKISTKPVPVKGLCLTGAVTLSSAAGTKLGHTSLFKSSCVCRGDAKKLKVNPKSQVQIKFVLNLKLEIGILFCHVLV